jgi:hypothetical protein
MVAVPETSAAVGVEIGPRSDSTVPLVPPWMRTAPAAAAIEAPNVASSAPSVIGRARLRRFTGGAGRGYVGVVVVMPPR